MAYGVFRIKYKKVSCRVGDKIKQSFTNGFASLLSILLRAPTPSNPINKGMVYKNTSTDFNFEIGVDGFSLSTTKLMFNNNNIKLNRRTVLFMIISIFINNTPVHLTRT